MEIINMSNFNRCTLPSFEISKAGTLSVGQRCFIHVLQYDSSDKMSLNRLHTNLKLLNKTFAFKNEHIQRRT